MSKQYNKHEKRKRREAYLKRKNAAKKSGVKRAPKPAAAAPSPAPAPAAPPAPAPAPEQG